MGQCVVSISWLVPLSKQSSEWARFKKWLSILFWTGGDQYTTREFEVGNKHKSKSAYFQIFSSSAQKHDFGLSRGVGYTSKTKRLSSLAYSLLVQAYIGLFVFLILVVKWELDKGYGISGTVSILDSERNLTKRWWKVNLCSQMR